MRLAGGLLIAFVTLMVCTSQLGCSRQVGDDGQVRGKLIVTGSSTVSPLVAEIAKRFEKQHPDVRVDVQAGGSGKGIADARNGQADIGMASRELKTGEEDLDSHAIAADGVCLIVHRSNSVPELNRQQVVGIYSDRINNWSQVGGPDLPIHVVHKAEGRATLEVFLSYFEMQNPDAHPDVIVGHNEQAIKTVAGLPGAIGYVSIGTAEADVANGVSIKLLPMEGIEASSQSVALGEFPMSRRLNLVTKGEQTRLVREFVKFASSPQVHDLIREQYFVPIEN